MSASAVPYYFCNPFTLIYVKVECRPRFLRFQKLENNLKSYISDTATNIRPLEDIRLNLQHTFIVKFHVLSLLCVHWNGRPHFSTFGAGRILV